MERGLKLSHAKGLGIAIYSFESAIKRYTSGEAVRILLTASPSI